MQLDLLYSLSTCLTCCAGVAVIIAIDAVLLISAAMRSSQFGQGEP